MPQINVSDSDKDWFDEFKESDETQAEAFSRMRKQVQAYNGEPMDAEEFIEELKPFLGATCELGAFRGAKEAVEGSE